jgi:ectoine hydroxylase-related dioxygenase (phytanoyl-CoA dioxygenase family)
MSDLERQAIFKDSNLQKEFELHGYVRLSLLSTSEVGILKENYEKQDWKDSEGFYSTSFSEDDDLKDMLDLLIQNTLDKSLKEILHPHQSLGSCYLSKAPGKKSEMPIHQDWTVVDETKYDSVTIWIPLQDVDAENGALQVVPGSHRFSNILRSPFFKNSLNEIEETLRSDLKNMPLKAGEAIIFSQALMHASPPNFSPTKRLAITYGFIPKEAQLIFYCKSEEGLREKFEVSPNFFKEYNTKIGEKPQNGKRVEVCEMEEQHLSLSNYQLSKKKYWSQKNKASKMIPLFKDKQQQATFEKEGYLVLPLIDSEEIEALKSLYQSLHLKDEKGFGFHVSMDGLEASKSKEVRDEIWRLLLPKLDQYLENYKPFVASYVVKEVNPKGVVPAHQDWSFVDKEEDGYSSITCWTALIDTYLDNGCMGVIKGSHRIMQNKRPSPSPQTPVPLSEHMFSVFPYLTTIEMKAGEVLFFDNRTFHASPPNTEDHIRLAVGVGVTQKDAALVHYNLKPDSENKTIQKYAIDPDFFLKYNNSRLAEMFDNKESIQDYELIGEEQYTYDNYSSEELVEIIKTYGNDFNVPMCEKLSVLFGYDMSGKKKALEKEEEPEKVEAQIEENDKSFFEVYTPLNILREVKFRITGK